MNNSKNTLFRDTESDDFYEIDKHEVPKGVKIDYTGQIEEQNKQMSFLMGAFFAGLGLIMLILIFQFSSICCIPTCIVQCSKCINQ